MIFIRRCLPSREPANIGKFTWRGKKESRTIFAEFIPYLYGTELKFTGQVEPSSLVLPARPPLAGEEGIEPSPSVLETDVLPLNYSPFKGVQRRAT